MTPSQSAVGIVNTHFKSQAPFLIPTTERLDCDDDFHVVPSLPAEGYKNDSFLTEKNQRQSLLSGQDRKIEIRILVRCIEGGLSQMVFHSPSKIMNYSGEDSISEEKVLAVIAVFGHVSSNNNSTQDSYSPNAKNINGTNLSVGGEQEADQNIPKKGSTLAELIFRTVKVRSRDYMVCVQAGILEGLYGCFTLWGNSRSTHTVLKLRSNIVQCESNGSVYTIENATLTRTRNDHHDLCREYFDRSPNGALL
uniref:Uncharacterized protein n=1 Tax=Timema bartmani TaxID=61472 RepID=A0A7R9F530_9NEOP|nr:unnamed protein product [Timema bartmani]